MTSKKDSCGIALVFVGGLLSLLAVLLLAFIQGAVIARLSGETAATCRQATLSAESGLAYAAARLWEDERGLSEKKIAPTEANGCDDWTARGSEPAATVPSRRRNPSYTRGDRWADADGDGAFVVGTDTLPASGDLEGNGRFDAWSGRLRGGTLNRDPRFSLRIEESSRGRICINSGELGDSLDDHDRDGVLNEDDLVDSTPYLLDSDGNGIPDWRDPDFNGNVHLVNTLANLGAETGVSDAHSVPFVPKPNQMIASKADLLGEIWISDLGRTVVANRPRGGYASVRDLLPVLGPADYARVEPFLTTSGLPVWISKGGAGVDPNVYFARTPENAGFERRVPVDLNHAPFEVLASLLRHITASGAADSLLPQTIPPNPPSPVQQWFTRLSKGEADAVAQAIIAARQAAPIRVWRDLLLVLDANKGIFQPDPFIVAWNADPEGGDGVVNADPVQILDKEDLILAHLDNRWQFPDASTRAWNTLEVDREPVAAGADGTRIRRYERPALSACFVSHDTHPFTFDLGGGGPGVGDVYNPISPIPDYSTMGGMLTLAPGSFHVASDGWLAGAADGPAALHSMEGEVHLTIGMVAAGAQQDFTPLFASGAAGDPNPAVWRLAGGEVFYDRSQPAVRTGIQSFPRFPLVGPDGQGTNCGIGALVNPSTPFSHVPPQEYRHPRGHGWLQLSARQFPGTPDGTALWLGNPDISYAIPMNEDGIAGPGFLFDPADWRDNLYDPVIRPGVRAPYPSGASLNICSPRKGTLLSPSCEKRSGAITPLPGILFESVPPFIYSVPNGYGSNALMAEEGTIVLWTPNTEDVGTVSAPATLPAMECQVRYGGMTASGGGKPWFSLGWDHNRRKIGLKTSDPNDPTAAGNLTTECDYPTGLPASLVAGSGWHCVAFRFRRDLNWVDPGVAGAQPPVYGDLFLDGVQANAVPIPIFLIPSGSSVLVPVCLSGQTAFEVVFDRAAIDDLCLFRRGLSDAEILEIARVPRYAPGGRYTSQRFRFDPARLPQGGTPRRIAWDAFLPQSAGAVMTFTLNSYDSAGNKTASVTTSPYTGVQDPWLKLDGISHSDSFDYEVVIATNPASGILRDTPVIEEVRIEYGGPRPRWSGLTER